MLRALVSLIVVLALPVAAQDTEPPAAVVTENGNQIELEVISAGLLSLLTLHNYDEEGTEPERFVLDISINEVGEYVMSIFAVEPGTVFTNLFVTVPIDDRGCIEIEERGIHGNYITVNPEAECPGVARVEFEATTKFVFYVLASVPILEG